MGSISFERIKKLGEKVIERAQKISLPFFDGVPLYDVALFFWRSIVDGSITTRASAIAFSFFIALFPGVIGRCMNEYPLVAVRLDLRKSRPFHVLEVVSHFR